MGSWCVTLRCVPLSAGWSTILCDSRCVRLFLQQLSYVYGWKQGAWQLCDTQTILQDANLWDVSVAPTVVMTQRGARTDFQRQLRARGVEVVEFDFLTPHAVAAYCYDRGFLQCLWECGGTLSAPAIAAGVIHKTLAFIAPKLVSIQNAMALHLTATSIAPSFIVPGVHPFGVLAANSCI